MTDRARAGDRVSSLPPIVARLARLRVPLGFISGIAVLWLARPTRGTLAAGAAVAVAGEAFRVWAAGHLNKAQEVTMSGPYRWVAHPLYVGSLLMGAGLAIASGSIAATSLIAAYLTITLGAAVVTEETYLRHHFGHAYDRYRGRSAGEIGGVRPATEERRRFSMARAIANREHRALAGLVLAVLLLVLKAAYNGVFWQPGG
jgi:protein-S-isoprenylcysteine O-methyltransferase Ste14